MLYIVIAVYLYVKNLAHRSVLEWLRDRLNGNP